MVQRRGVLYTRAAWLAVPACVAFFLLLLALGAVRLPVAVTYADPIPPPEGYPKLLLSVKTVTPTLAGTSGESLYYVVELRNTGAYTAVDTTWRDPLPPGTTYGGDAASSAGPPPQFFSGELSWTGDVGFDASVFISFSVDLTPGFFGTVLNTAVVSQAQLAEAVTLTAQTVVTDEPILVISKSAAPALPGPNKALTYTLTVANLGQPAVGLPITVTDQVPADTTLLAVGEDGTPGPGEASVSWTRTVSLSHGASSVFTFSVTVADVASGTVLINDEYGASGAGIAVGEPFTITVVDPDLSLFKSIWPDPPGSNRTVTYTLTVLNQGSLATDLVVTDMVPEGITYIDGGDYTAGQVTWTWPRLDTGDLASFTFTAAISDVAAISVTNALYDVCSAEGACASGEAITNVVRGPSFLATAAVDPIAKKPGGGGGPVTPTLVVKNLGPGNAVEAMALLRFERISVQASDVEIIPPTGSLVDGPDCGDKCNAFVWTGDIGVGDVITFTTYEGQNSIGGAEGTLYTATIVISDSLGLYTTEPVSATASGRVTHLANLIPTKLAPRVIGAGQLMTYTIEIWNSALATDEPPAPWLTDTVPPSVTLVTVNDGGASYALGEQTVVSWTLPAMSPGERLRRSYVVRVDADLISGTQLVNEDYRVAWFEIEDTAIFSNAGLPVTTTVREVGLIDSFKVVTPALALPAADNVLTYVLHIVNSGPTALQDVRVVDWLPWEHSTYHRDAMASAGSVISDIVSLEWSGDLDPFSEAVLTLTVRVDPFYEGAITNTAVISHPDLRAAVTVHAVSYITDEPVLRISKTAAPDPVLSESALDYTIEVLNLGQRATMLVVTDTIPAGTTYVLASATGNGQLQGDWLRWEFLDLQPGKLRRLSFQVMVGRQETVVNDAYGVRSAEGAIAYGPPVVTQVTISGGDVYLPLLLSP